MPPKRKTRIEYYFDEPIFGDDLFCDLSPKSLKSLERIKRKTQFQEGVCIFAKGDLPCCIYVLLKGRAQFLQSESPEVRPVEKNEILGLPEMLANSPFEASVKAVTNCLCECISRDDFIEFLHEEPRVCFRLVQLLGSRLQTNYRLFCSSKK